MKKKRGQAAVEFLTTYGWAMMAVVVIIGSLSYFDLLDTKRFVSEKCDFGSQIQCMEVYANDDTGVGSTHLNFKLSVRNNYPVNIIIQNMYVDGTDLVDKVKFPNGIPVKAGESTIFNGNVNQMSRGSKEDMAAVITFRRDATGTKSYNITGSLIVKVQNHVTFPIAEQEFVCGNFIREYTEQCDQPYTETETCASFDFEGPVTPSVRCLSTCKWDFSTCK